MKVENVGNAFAIRQRVWKWRWGRRAEYWLWMNRGRVGMSDVFRSTDVITRGNQPSRQTSVLFSYWYFGRYVSR